MGTECLGRDVCHPDGKLLVCDARSLVVLADGIKAERHKLHAIACNVKQKNTESQASTGSDANGLSTIPLYSIMHRQHERTLIKLVLELYPMDYATWKCHTNRFVVDSDRSVRTCVGVRESKRK